MNRVGHEHENSQGPISIALCQLKLHAKKNNVYVNPRPATAAAAVRLAAVRLAPLVYNIVLCTKHMPQGAAKSNVLLRQYNTRDM